MARRKSVGVKWTLILFVVILCPFVYSRPQESSTLSSSTTTLQTDKATENPIRDSSITTTEAKLQDEVTISASSTPNAPRNNKNKSPVIGESIKMVASQLLESPANSTGETPVVIDTRIPPKLKNQIVQKHKIKTRNEDGIEPLDNSHPGVAVPVTLEELESENKVSESSTSNEGISTWILLSNPTKQDNVTSTEPTKTEEPQKKQKTTNKNKTKRPSNNKVTLGKRPIIGSTNKSDLVAGGSAINENVLNKIKDTVLSNVQKNKNSLKTTTVVPITTTSTSLSTEAPTTKKEVSQSTKSPASVAPAKISTKPTKKKNKKKNKTTTTPSPVDRESALLPMEPKEQEIELEISTPATTTKKPKRSSIRKKNKTKKRKTSKPKPTATTLTEVKTSNKTKTKTKKPDLTSLTAPITSSIYNYFSREVMPSVGVGVLGLASLVGLAGYFLYPFSTPVRRTFEVDKKDDIYRHNAEEYASEGNGQAEEEMLGTVLAGMPAHSKQKLNPYAGQTAHINRYPVKKEQDIRYRHVAAGYDSNYNVHYPQQKTGLAHGVVYSEPYNPKQYETRHVYTTESKYVYDKGSNAYTSRPVSVEPIYTEPQTGQSAPSAISAYGNDASNSVVYGVKPSSESDFKPVYPFEGQFYSETTSSPITYPPTSMYLGSNNDSEKQDEPEYSDSFEQNEGSEDNKFVVGNVPKELSDSVTPAVVPEHGPRQLRRRRHIQKRSIVDQLQEELNKAKKEKNYIFMSNEIEDAILNPVKKLASMELNAKTDKATVVPDMQDVYTVYALSTASANDDKATNVPSVMKTELVESVSTAPIQNQDKSTTESQTNDFETTTKSFRVYEVITSSSPDNTEQSSTVGTNIKIETTTHNKYTNTETTTELKSETTSTMPPSPSPVFDTTTGSKVTKQPPNVLQYPSGDTGFFSMLKRIIEFKYRLGLSILQTTSENLSRYLQGIGNTRKLS